MHSAQNQPQHLQPIVPQKLDSAGFLIDPCSWSRAFTEQRAFEQSIVLEDHHWRLIETIRDKVLRLGSLPPMRSLCKSVGVNRAAVSRDFGTCLNLWKIAGLPNPGEEAIAYMH